MRLEKPLVRLRQLLARRILPAPPGAMLALAGGVSGDAPTGPETTRFFRALRLPLQQIPCQPEALLRGFAEAVSGTGQDPTPDAEPRTQVPHTEA